MRTHEVSYFIGIICRMLERARGDEGRLDNAAGVTVVVPVFNAKPYLPDLISSLGVQDYQGGGEASHFRRRWLDGQVFFPAPT